MPLGRWRVSGLVLRKPDGTSHPLQVIAASPTFAPETGATGGLRPVGVRFVYGAPSPPME